MKIIEIILNNKLNGVENVVSFLYLSKNLIPYISKF